jgi:hypothetical protein
VSLGIFYISLAADQPVHHGWDKGAARSRAAGPWSSLAALFDAGGVSASVASGGPEELALPVRRASNIRQSRSKERRSFVSTRERRSRCPRGTASRSVTKISDFRTTTVTGRGLSKKSLHLILRFGVDKLVGEKLATPETYEKPQPHSTVGGTLRRAVAHCVRHDTATVPRASPRARA